MNQLQIDKIWINTDNLINHFKQYNLEKNISKVAIEYITNQIQQTNTYGSMKTQIENAAIEAVKSQIKQIETQRLLKEEQETQRRLKEEQEKQRQLKEEQETQRLEEDKKKRLLEEETQRLEEDKKKRRLEEEKQRLIEEEKEKQEAYENMKTNIEKTAMNAIVRELEKIQNKNTRSMVTSNLVNDTLARALNSASNNIVVTDNIKRSSIDAVKKELKMYETKNFATSFTSDMMKQTIDKLQDNTTLINSIKQTAIDAVSSELTKTQIKDVAINEIEKVPTDEPDDIKSLEQQLLDMMDEFEVINQILTNQQSNQDKPSTEATLKEKEQQITKLLSTIGPENLEKNEELKEKLEIYNRKKIDALPVGSDIESSIKNVAKNEVNENMVKRDLEEVAKTGVKNIATGTQDNGTEASENAVTDVAPSTTENIENDLRNAALVALYRALLEVPIKPLNVKIPPSEYDVLITDKTYDYDKKTGKRKEIPELTKYDRILAK